MLRLRLENPIESIRALDACELPDFAVLIGRNGVGKSQLLAAIAARQIRGAVHKSQSIEKYDISSFRTNSSGRAGYGGALFAERTAQRFFGEGGGQSPSNLAHEIYDRTIKRFGLTPGTHGRQEFDMTLRSTISVPDFRPVGVTKVKFAASDLKHAEKAVEHYTREVVERVVQPLAPEQRDKEASGRQSRRRRNSYNNDSAILVSMAMRLARKLPHEIDRSDILRAAHYEGDTIANTLSQAFTRYKAEQYSWAITESEQGRGDVGCLIDVYRRDNVPPWEVLREVLTSMRDAAGGEGVFDFEFTDPEADRLNHADHMQYSFETQMTNRTTGASYKLENLSSGEAVLMTLCMAWFNQSMGRKRPALLLLDEVDAMLHPSMVGALVSCLEDLFVRHGTRVMMASHCPATVAVLEEGKVFRVSHDAGVVRIRPVPRSEAVEELSDGIATLDTGLRIATADDRPVTIVTEGKNALILRRWATLHFPNDVSVFDQLPNRTGASQLQSYALILSKMRPDAQLLFVWDCDQADKIERLAQDIGPDTRVSTHVLSHRDNEIAERGIENKFEADVIRPYAEETRDAASHETLRVSFRKDRKTAFAEHIAQHGTKEDFRHFQDLHDAVLEILEKERRANVGGSQHVNRKAASGDGA